MAQRLPARRKVPSPQTPVSIPDKLYFRIGDVAELCSLPAYVLRFWETEFPQLKPNKGGTGQRLYRKRDVEMVLEIRRLLYDEGFTIAGARRILVEKLRGAASGHVAKSDSKSGPEEQPVLRSGNRISGVQKKASVPPSDASRPAIKDLRKEMRELLALLGSEPAAEQASRPALRKKDSKKKRLEDEPTLF